MKHIKAVNWKSVLILMPMISMLSSLPVQAEAQGRQTEAPYELYTEDAGENQVKVYLSVDAAADSKSASISDIYAYELNLILYNEDNKKPITTADMKLKFDDSTKDTARRATYQKEDGTMKVTIAGKSNLVQLEEVKNMLLLPVGTLTITDNSYDHYNYSILPKGDNGGFKTVSSRHKSQISDSKMPVNGSVYSFKNTGAVIDPPDNNGGGATPPGETIPPDNNQGEGGNSGGTNPPGGSGSGGDITDPGSSGGDSGQPENGSGDSSGGGDPSPVSSPSKEKTPKKTSDNKKTAKNQTAPNGTQGADDSDAGKQETAGAEAEPEVSAEDEKQQVPDKAKESADQDTNTGKEKNDTKSMSLGVKIVIGFGIAAGLAAAGLLIAYKLKIIQRNKRVKDRQDKS